MSAKQQSVDNLAMTPDLRGSFSTAWRGRASIRHDPRVDTRTKLFIIGMALLVLAFLVIGGILAIASPPSSCC